MDNQQDRTERERQDGLGTLGERVTHAGMAAEQEEQRASNQGVGHGTADTQDPAEQGKQGNRDQSMGNDRAQTRTRDDASIRREAVDPAARQSER